MIFNLEYCADNAIENAPFKIDRPEGSYRYIFFHFSTSVTIKLGGEETVLDPGTCILYEPGRKQYFYTEKSRLNHDYIDFVLNEKDFFKKINFPVNKPFKIKESELITKLIKEIIDEQNSESLGSHYYVESKMIEFFVLIARKFHHRKTYSYNRYKNEIKEIFEQLRLTIYENPDQLKISNIAKKLGFSLTRFSSLYKTFFGVTPIEDLTKARMSRVNDLIQEGKTTKEIVKIIGFSSEEYFYRWFKQNFKTTKEEYINKLLSQELN